MHALSQIVHFDTAAAREEKEWLRGANHLLRPRASLLWAQKVDSGFHARYGALSRRYCYVICEDDSLAPFLSGKVFFRDAALNIANMRAAAKLLIGKNDFTSFRAAGCSAKTPLRNLTEITFTETPPFTTITFRADGFLRRMVLNITGALLSIGRGEQPPQWTDALLKAKDRTAAPPPAKACGLYFLGAQYPKEFNLPPTLRALPFIKN